MPVCVEGVADFVGEVLDVPACVVELAKGGEHPVPKGPLHGGALP